jgi:hypothetical protein
MKPTHPHGPVENATAPSAGGSPDPDGEAAPFSDGLRLGGCTGNARPREPWLPCDRALVGCNYVMLSDGYGVVNRQNI